MQIEVSSRHGSLESAQAQHVRDKAEKLVRIFDRVMAIEVAVDHGKHGKPFWFVEILVSAEHKHDFVASAEGQNLEMVADACVHKLEQQLRRYKEKIQRHKGDEKIQPQMGDAEARPQVGVPSPGGVAE